VKVKVPDKIHVGAYEFDIVQVPDMARDYKFLGQAHVDNEVIRINQDSKYRVKYVTLWHEICHAVCDTLRMDLDEASIDRLGQGLGAILMNDFGIELEWDE